jgi:hypothetical protein
MTDLDKIKIKLKKLFALSKSPNANEAALALEMAQKLMIEHGIKRNDVGEFEVIKDDVRGNGGERPPTYEAYLVSSIAEAFGCRASYGYQGSHTSKSEYTYIDFGHTFVGLEHRVQIACFVATVLLRKIKKARNNYMKQLTRVRSRTNKMKRADEFCFGWAYTAVDKLLQFTNTDEEQKAIDNYIANLKWGGKLKTTSRGTVKKSGIKDFVNGRQAAADVQIQHGVEGKERGALLISQRY